MAIKTKSAIWQQLHLLARLIGISGVAAAVVGAFIWFVFGQEVTGIIVLCSAAGAVALALIFEVKGVAQTVASHRGLFGFNVVLQVGLALAIVVAANLYSFEHFRRFDLTRDQIFTLDESTRKQLEQLRGETEIIVVQNYVSFGQSAENKQDKYDFAAQRKIVEKVKDLAEAFQDLGPRFHVRILDIQDENNDKKLEDLRAHASEELVQAIRKAPENSVFFYSKEKKAFQRLSFSDIYVVDKQSSVQKNNLILRDQGVGPFARKILNIEERTPRIATAVVHPVLGFQDKRWPPYTMSGAKKALDAYGFDCFDIALRKVDEDGDIGDPTVLTYDESLYEEIDDYLADLTDEMKELEELASEHKFLSESSLDQIRKKYAFLILPDGRAFLTERASAEKIKMAAPKARILELSETDHAKMIRAAEQAKDDLDGDREEYAKLLEKKGKLQVDHLAEKRRFSDLEAKAKAILADVDLLIVPRITLSDIPRKQMVPNRVHKLEAGQFNAVKAYLKQGKPVLFLLGPTNEFRSFPSFDAEADSLESMLGELGFFLPKQTILYKAEIRAFKGRDTSGIGEAKRDVELPGVQFDETTSIYKWGKGGASFQPHPIRSSMYLMNRAMNASEPDAPKDKKAAPAAKEDSLVRVRHPRPVYFMRTALPEGAALSILGGVIDGGAPSAAFAAAVWLKNSQQQPDDANVILVTRPESWNEENPFPVWTRISEVPPIVKVTKVPRYAPTKDDDSKKGTAEEERHGPFPIGVAVEAPLPASWFDKNAARPGKARVAVIGSGGVFVGPKLPAMKEKLLLDTVNWLLGRDDLLARDVGSWEYPRVSLSADELKGWYALAYGLPVLFIYLGTAVWLVRRMR